MESGRGEGDWCEIIRGRSVSGLIGIIGISPTSRWRVSVYIQAKIRFSRLFSGVFKSVNNSLRAIHPPSNTPTLPVSPVSCHRLSDGIVEILTHSCIWTLNLASEPEGCSTELNCCCLSFLPPI
jgi:hypothetical protein